MKNSFFLLIIGILLLVNNGYAKKYEFKRSINKEFTVGDGAGLTIDNKYGHIVISTWEHNKIDFSIEITGYAEKEEWAQAVAESITVNFRHSRTGVSARTEISQQKNMKHSGMTIHYTVRVPASVYMNLTNKYGNVSLDKSAQSLKADIKYGNFQADRLTGENNQIVVKYGNLVIGDCSKLSLDIKYGDVKTGRISEWTLNSGYAKIHAEEIGKLIADSKYDKFNIVTLGEMVVNTAYTDMSIGKLLGLFEGNSLKYCKVNIGKVDNAFSKIQILGAYTPVKLGCQEDLSCQVNLSASYGKINMKGFAFSSKEMNPGDDAGNRYKSVLVGILGEQKDPGAMIRISTTYSDITFSK